MFGLGVCVVNGLPELAHAHPLRHCKMAAIYFVARQCPELAAASAAAAAVPENRNWLLNGGISRSCVNELDSSKNLARKQNAGWSGETPSPNLSLVEQLPRPSLPVFLPTRYTLACRRRRTIHRSASLALGACGLLRALLRLLP